MLASSENNIGIMLQPEFTYKKNQLWMLENAHAKDLASHGISLDKGWILMFKEKVSVQGDKVSCVDLPNSS